MNVGGVRPRARRMAHAALVGVSALLLLTGCISWFQPDLPESTSSPTLEDVPAALAPYYHQELRWRGCGGGMQCATATAPLDWADPTGDTIELALIRQPATEGSASGSLLINPGGPGGSGVDFVRDSIDFAVSHELQRTFDVVGFDPRGVGGSSAVRCARDDAELDRAIYEVLPYPRGSDEWIAAAEKQAREFGERCLRYTGALLEHVDTGSAVRDLDMLRAALGDETLSYLGYSYGTYLGARYAEAFPDRVGRLVLDGALDPATSEFEVIRGQAIGFEGALTAYLEHCLAREGCPFAGTVTGARARIAELLHEVDAHPLAGADGRMLGSDALFAAIIVTLYSSDSWTFLDDLFEEMFRGVSDTAFFLADVYNDRSADGSYRTNSWEASIAINCLDYPSDPDVERMRHEAEQLASLSPVFGPWMAYSGTQCPQMPFLSHNVRAPIVAPGTPDILVIGTTGDPATPYPWAQTLAEDLERGHLVTYDGEGHTAYGENVCVTETVDDFLISGTVPASDPMC